MAELTIEQLIERFELGGEWKIMQVAKMTGWKRVTIYYKIDHGCFGPDGTVRRSERDIRIKGEALAKYLKKLQRL
jgi:hypothetical protein